MNTKTLKLYLSKKKKNFKTIWLLKMDIVTFGKWSKMMCRNQRSYFFHFPKYLLLRFLPQKPFTLNFSESSFWFKARK